MLLRYQDNLIPPVNGVECRLAFSVLVMRDLAGSTWRKTRQPCPPWRRQEGPVSKPVRLVLGIATLWPLAYLLIFMGFVFSMLLRGNSQPQGGRDLPSGVIAIFVLHGITIVWLWVLLAIYIYNVFHNDRVDKDKKALWAVVLFLGNMIAMPIYWYLYIGTDDSSPPTSAEE